MANTFKFGNKNWAWKEGSVLAYNDENNNFKPLPFDFTRSSSATRVNKDGLIEVVGSDEPRVDYLNNADGHLLLEPSRTNLYTYSNDFSAWTASSATITTNYSTSPDGNINANRIQFATGGLAYVSSTGSAGENTLSVYAKATNGTSAKFRFFANGTLTYSSDQTATGEWQRFEFTYTYSSVTAGLTVATTGADDVMFYGFQHEIGSYATSYIPTSGSSVTRNAENQTIQELPEAVLGSDITQGTLYLEMEITQSSLTRAISIVSSLAGNAWNSGSSIRFDITANSSATAAYVQGTVGSSGNNVSTVGINVGDVIKMASSWNGTSSITAVNGNTSTGTIATFTTRPKYLFIDELGTFAGGGNNMGNKFIQVKLYNTALTDSELIALTS